tara:strand:+ start:641 stop:952 length:312 start_codon:yes stop_codon:yes gene_type:complete
MPVLKLRLTTTLSMDISKQNSKHRSIKKDKLMYKTHEKKVQFNKYLVKHNLFMIEFLKKKIDKNQGVPINLENRIQILEQRNDFLEKEIDLKARIWQTSKYNK